MASGDQLYYAPHRGLASLFRPDDEDLERRHRFLSLSVRQSEFEMLKTELPALSLSLDDLSLTHWRLFMTA